MGWQHLDLLGGCEQISRAVWECQIRTSACLEQGAIALVATRRMSRPETRAGATRLATDNVMGMVFKPRPGIAASPCC